MIFVSGANAHFARAVFKNVMAAGRAKSLVVGTRDVHTAFPHELAKHAVQVRETDFRPPDPMRQPLGPGAGVHE